MKIIFNVDLSKDQNAAVNAVTEFLEKVYNQDNFTQENIKRIRKEIKRVHTLCRESFGTPMFAWQANKYSLQMCLENKYQFIFEHDLTLTWTKNRWENTLAHELAILSYHSDRMEFNDFKIRLIACWMLFQYFNTSVLRGEHCRQIIDMTFNIVKNIDEKLMECIAEIKNWREENAHLIKALNDSRSKWRKEKSRCERLVNGKMRSSEIELYHMVAVSDAKLSFEDNLKRISSRLGISLPAVKKLAKKYGYHEQSFISFKKIDGDEFQKKYDEELEWATKVLDNKLSKTEKREFWKQFKILNPITLFRTFTVAKPDIIPVAGDPLATSDDQPRPKDIMPSRFNPQFLNDSLLPGLSMVPTFCGLNISQTV